MTWGNGIKSLTCEPIRVDAIRFPVRDARDTSWRGLETVGDIEQSEIFLWQA